MTDLEHKYQYALKAFKKETQLPEDLAQKNKSHFLNANYLASFLPNIFDAELDLELCLPTSEISAVKTLPNTIAIYTNQVKPHKINLPQQEVAALKAALLALPHDIIDGDK